MSASLGELVCVGVDQHLSVFKDSQHEVTIAFGEELGVCLWVCLSAYIYKYIIIQEAQYILFYSWLIIFFEGTLCNWCIILKMTHQSCISGACGNYASSQRLSCSQSANFIFWLHYCPGEPDPRLFVCWQHLLRMPCCLWRGTGRDQGPRRWGGRGTTSDLLDLYNPCIGNQENAFV